MGLGSPALESEEHFGRRANRAKCRGYDTFLAYGGSSLRVDVKPVDVQDAGKKYLPYDPNISILLGLAGQHFDQGKVLLLKALPQD